MSKFCLLIFYSTIHYVRNGILYIKFFTKFSVQFWEKMFFLQIPDRLELFKSMKSKLVDPRFKFYYLGCLILNNLLSFGVKKYKLILGIAEVSQNIFCIQNKLFGIFDRWFFIIDKERDKSLQLFIIIFNDFFIELTFVTFAQKIFIFA